MEKGTKAAFFFNCPLLSRKFWGLKSWGLGKNFGSVSREPSIGNTSVSWKREGKRFEKVGWWRKYLTEVLGFQVKGTGWHIFGGL